MLKRIISLVLFVAMLMCFSSCDSAETGVVITNPVKVAVGVPDSSQFYASQDYAVEKGYELVEYETMESAIASVENGKNDFVVIDSNSATKELLESVNLEWVENTPYKVEYCAYFEGENESLQAKFNNAVKELKRNGIFDEINRIYSEGGVYIPNPNSFENGTLKILCSPVFDNFLYFDENGELAGKELSIIYEICSKLSMKAELVVVEFDELFYKLEQGEGDIIICALEYNKERAETFLCSDTYNQTTFGVYKRKS